MNNGFPKWLIGVVIKSFFIANLFKTDITTWNELWSNVVIITYSSIFAKYFSSGANFWSHRVRRETGVLTAFNSHGVDKFANSLFYNTDISAKWHCELVQLHPITVYRTAFGCALFWCWVSLCFPFTNSMVSCYSIIMVATIIVIFMSTAIRFDLHM